jgi:membrane-bound ClpP family serine protease
MLLMMLLMAFPVLGVALFFVTPWKVALPGYLAGTAIGVFYHLVMMKSRKIRVTTGHRGMVGQTATVITWGSAQGTVRCHGEIWKARTEHGGSMALGSEASVVDVKGLVLVVRPMGSQDGSPTVDTQAPPLNA